MSKKSRTSFKGDCFVANLQLFLDQYALKPGAKLIHGICVGTGGTLKGKEFGHCWIEYQDQVIDVANGKNIHIGREIYHHLGRIGYTHAYTWMEVLTNLNQQEHYGPWDNLILESYSLQKENENNQPENQGLRK